IRVAYIIFKIFNHKLKEKKFFFYNESILIKIITLIEINKISLIDVNNPENSKIISDYKKIENRNYESYDGYAKTYLFNLGKLNPGIYLIKADGEESDIFIVFPEIKISILNDFYNGIILSPLNKVFFQIDIEQQNSCNNFLDKLILKVSNIFGEEYGTVKLNSLLKNQKISLEDIFKNLTSPINKRLNFRKFIIEFLYQHIIIKKIEIKILPELDFINFKIDEINYLNQTKFIINYYSNYNYLIKATLELANKEDKYLIFLDEKIPCEIDDENKEIIINSNKIFPGILYNLIITLKLEQGNYVINEKLNIGKIILLKDFSLKLNKFNYILQFKNPKNHLIKFIIKKNNDYKSINIKKKNDIDNFLQKFLEYNIIIKKGLSKNEKLEFLDNFLREYNNIFIISQYDFILHPNLNEYINKLKEINKNENLTINILPFPCPTTNQLLNIKTLKRIEKMGKQFFPIIQSRCINCNDDEFLYYFFLEKYHKGTLYCEKCNNIFFKTLEHINFEKIKLYYPILNYIHIECIKCKTLMSLLKDENSSIYLICDNCGNIIKNINYSLNNYKLTKNCLTIISLRQLDYLIKRRLIFPFRFTKVLYEMKKKIYQQEKIEDIYKYMYKNYPKELNDKVLEYKILTKSKNDFEKINNLIMYLNDFFTQLKFYYKKLNDINNNTKQKNEKILNIQKKENKTWKKIKDFFKKIFIKIKNRKLNSSSLKISESLFKKDPNSRIQEIKQEIKNSKIYFKRYFEDLLQTPFGIELSILGNLNQINQQLNDIKDYKNLLNNIKEIYFNSEIFKKWRKIKDLENEIILLRDKWKMNLFSYILKIIYDNQNLDTNFEDTFKFYEVSDIDFSSINIDTDLNDNIQEKDVIKITQELLQFLQQYKFIDDYLKPINYNSNLSRIRKFNNKIQGFIKINNNYSKDYKFLFIFEDLDPSFEANFSFNFSNFSNLLNNLINEIKNLDNHSQVKFIFFTIS
ncbi:MAG: hypothetical protein ACTSRP_23790, partial [Candidatus Helarchaeota archaeon]